MHGGGAGFRPNFYQEDEYQQEFPGNRRGKGCSSGGEAYKPGSNKGNNKKEQPSHHRPQPRELSPVRVMPPEHLSNKSSELKNKPQRGGECSSGGGDAYKPGPNKGNNKKEHPSHHRPQPRELSPVRVMPPEHFSNKSSEPKNKPRRGGGCSSGGGDTYKPGPNKGYNKKEHPSHHRPQPRELSPVRVMPLEHLSNKSSEFKNKPQRGGGCSSGGGDAYKPGPNKRNNKKEHPSHHRPQPRELSPMKVRPPEHLSNKSSELKNKPRRGGGYSSGGGDAYKPGPNKGNNKKEQLSHHRPQPRELSPVRVMPPEHLSNKSSELKNEPLYRDLFYRDSFAYAYLLFKETQDPASVVTITNVGQIKEILKRAALTSQTTTEGVLTSKGDATPTSFK